jgi:hypothetical protein
MPQIIFTASGSSSAFGNFAPGDTLRCSDDEARHFVEEACCAKYAEAPAAADPAPADEPEPAAPAAAKAGKKRGAAA